MKINIKKGTFILVGTGVEVFLTKMFFFKTLSRKPCMMYFTVTLNS